MALYHRATITPSKPELVASWVGEPVEVIGAYRFDDPEGQVGMETFIAQAGPDLVHVPMTYRDTPLEDAGAVLIGETHHSALGNRWVYDGLTDPRYVMMLAAATLTGQGEALGMVDYDGVWHIAPTNVRIRGGGWGMERVSVDNFETIADTDGADTDDTVTMRNELFELTVHRKPAPGPQPTIGLTATWDGQAQPVVLAEITERIAG